MFDDQFRVGEPRLTLQVSAPDPYSGAPELKTPSDYFSVKYPVLTRRYGAAFLETHWLDSVGLLNVECDEINVDLFAGIIGGTDERSRVVYYQPDHEFLAFDRIASYFKVISEERLKAGLSQELIHCASHMSQHRQRVRIKNIFKRFRTDEVLDSILKRAKGLLAVDESFFAEGSGNRKAPELMTGEESAKQFVLEGMALKEGSILKFAKAYDQYVYFCDLKKVDALPKNSFRKPIVMAVRDTFGMGLRSDLKLDGKWIEGWKNVDTALAVAA
jgi:hypothetical protein